jgi:hypothetical protein
MPVSLSIRKVAVHWRGVNGASTALIAPIDSIKTRKGLLLERIGM